MPDADAAAQTLLLRARARRQWSQAELARRVGMPRSQLCAYETAAKQPTVATLARILAVCGVDLTGLGGPAERERQAVELEDVLGLADAMPAGPRRAQMAFGPFTRLIGS